MNKYFLVVILALLLSSCASISSKPQTPTDNWVLAGKMGIQSPTSNGSASFHWQQSGDAYHIRLFGPLGIGAVELIGQPQDVSFTNNQGQVFEARSADVLLRQNTGWQIPVSNLVYWIRGIPAPKYYSQKIYDTDHQLKILNQQGWQITYLKYQNGLPKLMQLNYSQIKLRISIDTFTYS